LAPTLPLGGKPEFARAGGRGTIFVNLEDTAQLVWIDAAAAAIKARWPLPQCQEPSGLALDAVHRRSFSTCGNQTLAILDIDNGRWRTCRSARASMAPSSIPQRRLC
jgi:hypothetical protein